MKTLFVSLLFLFTTQVKADFGYDMLGIILCKAPELCSKSELSQFDEMVINNFAQADPKIISMLCNDIANTDPKEISRIFNDILNAKQVNTCLEGKL